MLGSSDYRSSFIMAFVGQEANIVNRKNKENPTHYRITDLASHDQPRDRLTKLGAEVLSNAELVAILIRSGAKGRNAVQIGQDLLIRWGGLSGLHRAPFVELCSQHGIGEAKAAQIKAAIELGRRLSSASIEDLPTINSPEDAASHVLYEMGALENEHLRVMLLDTRNRLIRVTEVYRGSLNSSFIRIGEVFRDAIRSNAASIIVVHNHPSGDPTPSPEDIAVTREIVQAGNLIDINVLDHLVIGKNRFISLKSKGLGFT
jgi:DNA repair protein RadC